ncbi:MAG: SGNH/GDSL hydrolase family protein [Pontiella sp.]
MKRAAVILSIAALLPVAFAIGSPIRVMPLGDSITVGYPGTNSYRKTLKELLQNNGHAVDFVGSQTYGEFADNQHEGHNGWYADDATATNTILSHVAGWMTATPADIILLHIGTNDILSESANATEVSDILDEIFSVNSNATVVLALIINSTNRYNVEISTYNSNLNSMAQLRIASGEDLIVVDMGNGAGLDYTNPSVDMADTYHPSQLGYDKMATNWFPAVVQAIINQIRVPTIDSISVADSSVNLAISNLSTGKQITIEQTETLIPPAWSNVGLFVSDASLTNWTGPASMRSAYYRVISE